MNTLPAQEVKRRGVAAFDETIGNGPIHIIRRNRPEYVVISHARYSEMVEALRADYEARVLEAFEDYRAGRGRRFGSGAELTEALLSEGL